jgi:hypothetical protein
MKVRDAGDIRFPRGAGTVGNGRSLFETRYRISRTSRVACAA